MKKYLKLFLCSLFVLIFAISSTIAFAKPKVKGTPPVSPENLSYNLLNSSEVTLSWSPVASVYGYKIYKASPTDANFSLVATTSNTSFTDKSLLNSTGYWYYVVAYNTYGTSLPSNKVNFTTKAMPTAKQVIGFTTYYYDGDASSYNSMVNNSTAIDKIATHTYTTDKLGNISGLLPTSQINYSLSNGIEPLVMIANNFDGDIAKSILESSTIKKTLISNILTSLKAYGFKGVNIDFEGVYYYNRNHYTEFIKDLYETLKPLGYKVTLSLPAKASDSPSNTWNGAYDYLQLSKYADSIVVMTYDEHYPGGTPGAIASINWVENVIKYATSVVPKEKLILGVAAYSYDWSSKGTKAYSIPATYNLAKQYGSTILWDSLSQTPYFKYVDSSGINHDVWLENEYSVKFKLDLVNKYNLGGIAIWRLGLENPEYWTSIKEKLNR